MIILDSNQLCKNSLPRRHMHVIIFGGGGGAYEGVLKSYRHIKEKTNF
jgi:hypothetical protein